MTNLTSFIHDCHLNPPITSDNLKTLKNFVKSEPPSSYLELLNLTDGFDGNVSNGSYLAIWKSGEVAKLNTTYEAAKFLPGMLLIGSDGGSEAIGIDLRSNSPTHGHYYKVPFIPLSWDNANHLGPNFEDIKII